MIEVEVKALVENPESFRKAMSSLGFANTTTIDRQLNHYFTGSGDVVKALSALADKDAAKSLANQLKKGSKVSVRTRWSESEGTILVVKISNKDAENGTARIEAEFKLLGLTIDELDQALADSGYQVQAKWSRKREVWTALDPEVSMTMTLDFNAGYGWLAEAEQMLPDDMMDLKDTVQKGCEEFLVMLGATPLQEERLKRMFEYYNKHWQQYYGTNSTFVVR